MKSLPVLSHSVHLYCTLFDVVCCLYLIRLSFRLGSDRRGFELFDEIVGIALCEGAIIRTQFDYILSFIFIYTRQYRSWFCSITNNFTLNRTTHFLFTTISSHILCGKCVCLCVFVCVSSKLIEKNDTLSL